MTRLLASLHASGYLGNENQHHICYLQVITYNIHKTSPSQRNIHTQFTHTRCNNKLRVLLELFAYYYV